MGNVLEDILNWIFQLETTIRFILDVLQCCRARLALSFCKRPFLNPFVKFRDKLNLKFKVLSSLATC